jgi:hypothetical protein
MPRGLKKIEQLAADAKKRSDAYGSGEGLQRALVLKKGETAKGRFLEEGDGIWYLYTHELPKKPGQNFGDRVLCLDQDDEGKPCPGCEMDGVGRTARVVINFLRYDEPNLVRDAKNKPVKENGEYKFDGVKPAVVVWNAPQSVGGRLAFLESQRGGLTNHVCTIHRTQDNQNPWMIDILETKEPEEYEKALYDKKVEPNIAATQLGIRSIPLMSYGDMKRAYSGASVATGFQGGGEGQPTNGDGAPTETNVYQQAAERTAGGHVNPGAFGG